MVPSRAAVPHEKGRPEAAFLNAFAGAYCFVASSLFVLLDFFAVLVVFLLILSFDMSSPLLMVSPLLAAVPPALSWAKAVEERKDDERKARAAVAMMSLRMR
jgi:ABC-type Na+ efflux pump permease subunit